MKIGPIERDVAISDMKCHHKLSPHGQALREMAVGDSRSFDGYDKSRIQSMAHYIFGTNNYATRPEGSGIRVWRLK